MQKGETHDTMTGGVIEDNRCVNNGGGIHISESAALNVSGDPAVTGSKTQQNRKESIRPPEASPQEGFLSHLAHCLPVLSW